MQCTFSFVTETWLTDGVALDLQLENLLLGHGVSSFVKNRPAGRGGFSHGGIGIFMKSSETKFSKIDFPNPDNFEVLAVRGRLQGVNRQFVLICAYIPPNYTVLRGRACLQHISDLILENKRRFPDDYYCVGGDFNQWDIADALADYPDMREVATPPTRKDRKIDKMFVNWSDLITSSGCLPPLEAENAEGLVTSTSDHRIQFAAAMVSKKDKVKVETFTYRPFNDKSAELFMEEIKKQDWGDVLLAVGSDDKAAAFQATIDKLMNKHFPVKTVRRKSNDLPWINEIAKKKSEKKKIVYRYEGRSERWRALRKNLEEYLGIRKTNYLRKQRDKLMTADASRQFFKNVKNYNSHEKPKSFDVRDLRPDTTDEELADEIACFFNRISSEFEPLLPEQIPSTYHRDLPLLTPSGVEERLKKAKKPNSMVKGDIFPSLITPCAAALSVPLAAIYNEILTSYEWPVEWKKEYVTTIPKKSMPNSLADLRNISCTLFVSKLFESYVLQCASEEISLKENQFGGVKGCSTTHMLVDVMQEICSNAEDYRSATVLTAIDYAKAFNRVSFQKCLKAFEKKKSSTPILKLLATFLTGRTMTVRVGEKWSVPRSVNGGCPQGSILGVFLFNVTTEDLEEEFEKFEKNRLEPRQDTNVRINPNVRNVPAGLIRPPPETKVGTQVLTQKPVTIRKYVDDNLSCEKLNFGNVPIISIDGVQTKIKQALSSQNAFISVSTKAKEKGMIVNESKTALLCISDSLNFKTLAYIEDSTGERIDCVEHIKVLGFYLSDRTGVSKHVQELVKNIRRRYWSLRHLQKLGFSEEELVKVYKMSILPIADYCCPVYHSLLTDLQDQALEKAQIGALRCIFGYKLSARKLREKASLSTLRSRRVELTDKFAYKCLGNPRFRAWFPEKVGRQSARAGEKYVEEFAKCERLKNSPIFYMRRRLNGKEGKVYGEKNKEFRK